MTIYGSGFVSFIDELSKERPDGFTVLFDGTEPSTGIVSSVLGFTTTISSNNVPLTQGIHLVELELLVDRIRTELDIHPHLYKRWAIGGWSDIDTGQYHLDISMVFPSKDIDEAIRFGLLNAQRCLYDIDNECLIWLDHVKGVEMLTVSEPVQCSERCTCTACDHYRTIESLAP